MFDIVDSGIFS